MTHEEMAAELRQAGWRVEPPLTKENCKHPNAMGSSSLGSDGSSSTSWYCPACHDRFEWKTPPRPNRMYINWMWR